MRSARFRRTRRASAVTLVSALTLTALAACGTSSSDNGGGASGGNGSSDPSAPLDPKTKVTITIDCMPPTAKAAESKEWKQDVAEFNKTYPNVTIEGRSTPGQCLEPPRFTAMLKAKSQPDVFYTYFTDLPQVLDNDGAEDITAYVNDTTVPALKDIDPNVLGALKQDGKLYQQLHDGPADQPQAVRAGRPRPRRPAADLGGGPHRGEEDRRPGRRHRGLRRVQRGQPGRLALHRADVQRRR
jgi:ABC-type glycerol-3-phosphate transport system substrate-binding protein